MSTSEAKAILNGLNEVLAAADDVVSRMRLTPGGDAYWLVRDMKTFSKGTK